MITILNKTTSLQVYRDLKSIIDLNKSLSSKRKPIGALPVKMNLSTTIDVDYNIVNCTRSYIDKGVRAILTYQGLTRLQSKL